MMIVMLHGCAPSSGAALFGGTSVQTSTVARPEVNEVVAFGVGGFRWQGGGSATLEGASLVGASKDLHLHGISLLSFDENSTSLGVLHGDIRSQGFALIPVTEGEFRNRTDEFILVVEVSANKPGRYVIDGLEITYRWGSETLTTQFDRELVVEISDQ